jgi:hypothetical protein
MQGKLQGSVFHSCVVCQDQRSQLVWGTPVCIGIRGNCSSTPVQNPAVYLHTAVHATSGKPLGLQFCKLHVVPYILDTHALPLLVHTHIRIGIGLLVAATTANNRLVPIYVVTIWLHAIACCNSSG